MSMILARKIAARIQTDYNLTDPDLCTVIETCALLPSMPEGCVIFLKEIADVTIELDDIKELCSALEG